MLLLSELTETAVTASVFNGRLARRTTEFTSTSRERQDQDQRAYDNVQFLIVVAGEKGRQANMPRFVTIGYGDKAGYEKTPEGLRSAAHAHDKKLKDEGALIGVAGVPVQVRNTGGVEVKTETGAFMASQLPVAGFAIIEAEDLSQAVRMVAQTPCAIAYGVVEVWPLETRS